MKTLLVILAVAFSCTGCATRTPETLISARFQAADGGEPLNTADIIKPGAPNLPRVEALIVADTTDHGYYGGFGDVSNPTRYIKKRSIASGATADAREFERLIGDLSQATKMPVHARKIYGEQWGCDTINSAIQDMPIEKGGIAFVYYSGHGSGDSDDRHAAEHLGMPAMFCGTDGLPFNVSDIARLLAVKEPRLIVIIADACNSYEGVNAAAVQSTASAGPIMSQPNRYLAGLFGRASGIVLIAATRRGTQAWYQDSGGDMTLHLLNIYDKNRSKLVTWRDVMRSLNAFDVMTDNGLVEQQPICFVSSRASASAMAVGGADVTNGIPCSKVAEVPE